MRNTESYSYGASVVPIHTDSKFFHQYIYKGSDSCGDEFFFVVISECVNWFDNQWETAELRQTFKTVEEAQAKATRVIIALKNKDIELCPDEIAF